jgi:tRNA-binding EMAP/Myf-like protein
MADQWVCAECEQENDIGDTLCCACDAEAPAAAAAGGSDDDDDDYKNIFVAIVVECAAVDGKDKLKKCVLDAGQKETVQIVTNAPNVAEGSRVVVALVGAVVNEVVVRKATVGGVASTGMLCDAPMLKWNGGGAGNAALVPPSFAVGSKPPSSRPRMDGK